MPTAQNPPSVFEQVGPLLDDWENYLNSIAAHLEQHGKAEEPNQHNKDENLFQQVKTIFPLIAFLHVVETYTTRFISEQKQKIEF